MGSPSSRLASTVSRPSSCKLYACNCPRFGYKNKNNERSLSGNYSSTALLIIFLYLPWHSAQYHALRDPWCIPQHLYPLLIPSLKPEHKRGEGKKEEWEEEKQTKVDTPGTQTNNFWAFNSTKKQFKTEVKGRGDTHRMKLLCAVASNRTKYISCHTFRMESNKALFRAPDLPLNHRSYFYAARSTLIAACFFRKKIFELVHVRPTNSDK